MEDVGTVMSRFLRGQDVDVWITFKRLLYVMQEGGGFQLQLIGDAAIAVEDRQIPTRLICMFS